MVMEMTVTVDEIRLILNDITSDLVSDSVIQKNIDIATDYINAIKSSSADDDLVETAIKFKAVVLTLLSYSTAVERVSGSVPPSVINQANEYEDILNEILKGIKGASSAVFVADTTDTVLDDVYDC